jgi:hypothetical protein
VKSHRARENSLWPESILSGWERVFSHTARILTGPERRLFGGESIFSGRERILSQTE